MTITISQVAATQSLRTEIIAGLVGSDRPVGWAHVCELAEPWEWVGQDDLVLTTGLGIPPDPVGQVRYVTALDEIGAAGVAIGDRMNAPPLSTDMLAAADEAGFPILLTSYEIRFSRISHIVAMANVDQHGERLTRSLRILEQVSHLVSADGQPPDFDFLIGELDCELVLIDPQTWQLVPPSEPARVPAGTITSVRDQLHGPLPERPWPAVVAGRQALVTPITEPRSLLLVAIPRDRRRPDLLLLEQAATVISVQQAYLFAARERTRRLGSSALAHLIDQRFDEQLTADALAEAGIGAAARLVAARHGDASDALSDLHHALDDARVDHMMLVRSDVMLLLINEDGRSLASVTSGLPPATRAGISAVIDPHTGLFEALREARSALRSASDRSPIVRFEDAGQRSPFMPPDAAATRELALDVLGELLEYDLHHASDLAATLRVFLEENRGWQRSANRLFVHRQTLVYRVKRIEELIDRDLRSTADVAEVWLAVQAAIESGLIA